MTAITPIDYSMPLKITIGEPQVKMLTEYVEQKVAAIFDASKEQLATKGDVLALKEDIAKVETKIAERYADTLKWMIVLFAPFYIGMIVFLIKQFL